MLQTTNPTTTHEPTTKPTPTTYRATTSTHELITSKDGKAVRVRRAICVTLTEGQPGPTARAYMVDEHGARVRDSFVPSYSYEAATTFPQDVRHALHVVTSEVNAYYVNGLNSPAGVPSRELCALMDEARKCADAIARTFRQIHAAAGDPCAA